MTVVFAEECTSFTGAQSGDGRRVNGVHTALLAAEAHRFDWQVLAAPLQGALKQGIQRELAALQGALNPVPSPAQLDHRGQGGPRQTPSMLAKLTRHHGEEHDPDKVGRAGRQSTAQTGHGVGRQVHWRSSQMARWFGKIRHLPRIAKSGCILLLNW
jgi:hypothetical protein